MTYILTISIHLVRKYNLSVYLALKNVLSCVYKMCSHR